MNGEEHLNPIEHTEFTDVEIREDLREQQFGVELVSPHDPKFEAAKQAEGRIFEQAFHNSPEEMEEEYGAYDQASRFLLVRDRQNGEIAGIMRLISWSAAGLKSFNDLGKVPWNADVSDVLRTTGMGEDLSHVVDIATLGVAEGYRLQDKPEVGAKVSSALYHGLYRFSTEVGARYWITILDDNVLNLVQQLGTPFQRYEGIEPASYLGSESSTPAWCDLLPFVERLKVSEPEIYRLFIQGEVLGEDIHQPSALLTPREGS